MSSNQSLCLRIPIRKYSLLGVKPPDFYATGGFSRLTHKALRYTLALQKTQGSGSPEGMEIMQQAGLYGVVGRHAQYELALRTYQAASTLNELAAEGAKS